MDDLKRVELIRETHGDVIQSLHDYFCTSQPYATCKKERYRWSPCSRVTRSHNAARQGGQHAMSGDGVSVVRLK